MMLKLINKVFGFVLKVIDKVSKWTTVPEDKIIHFLCGGFIALVMSLIYHYNDISLLWAVTIAAIIGAVKELVWDKWWKKGYPDWWDFIATVLGGAVVVLIYMWI